MAERRTQAKVDLFKGHRGHPEPPIHREANVTSFLEPTPPSSSASDELMSSSALDQPPSSSGASREWDVLLQPRGNSFL